MAESAFLDPPRSWPFFPTDDPSFAAELVKALDAEFGEDEYAPTFWSADDNDVGHAEVAVIRRTQKGLHEGTLHQPGRTDDSPQLKHVLELLPRIMDIADELREVFDERFGGTAAQEETAVESVVESGEPTPTQKQLTVTVAEKETDSTLLLLLKSGKQELTVVGELSQVFKLLVAGAITEPGQPVEYSKLESGSSRTASQGLRKTIGRIRKLLCGWQQAPDEKVWVPNRKSKDNNGYFLNTSVTWKLSKQLQSELLPVGSVFSHSVGVSIGETSWPNGPNLPARPRNKRPIDSEDDD